MNKNIRIFGLGVLTVLLVFTLFSIVSANGTINLIVNSPEDGLSYDISQDVLFSAEVLSNSNVQLYNVYAIIALPDGSFQTLNLFQSGVIPHYEGYFTPTILGAHKTTIYAEDSSGNWDSEDRIFYITEEIISNPNFLTILYPENGEIYDNFVTEFNFEVQITSPSIQIPISCWYVLNGQSEVPFPCALGLNDFQGILTIEGINTLEVFATDNLGTTVSDSVAFEIDTSGQGNDFDLVIIFPENNAEFDVGDVVNLKAKVYTLDDVEIIVMVKIKMPNGQGEIITLNSSDNFVFIGNFLNTNEEGEYKVTFLAKDTLGNSDEEVVYFEVKDCSPGGSGPGGSGSTLYYLCIEWSDWFDCIDGVQERVCTNEVRTRTFEEGVSLTSQLWSIQEKACEIKIIDVNEDDSESRFRSWMTGSVVDFFSSTGTLMVLIFFVLLLLLLLVILAIRKRNF